jgi:hypothetical protein
MYVYFHTMKGVICLSIYNNEFGLPYCLNNIAKLAQCFDTLHVIAFYDESQDRSFQLLNEFKRDNEIDLTILVNNNTKYAERTANIAFARNSLLTYIRTHFADCDYFIMMDTNEYSCIGNIQVDVFKDAIDKRDLWDAISFDRDAGYYDTWALSFDPFIYSFFHFHNWKNVVEKMRIAFNLLLNNYKTNYPDKLIPVYSAFNGFAIYKTSKFLNCSYSSNIHLDIFPPDSINKQIALMNIPVLTHLNNDCEHRKFHLEAIKKNGAKIMISTKSLFAKFINPPINLRGPA